MGGSNPFSKPKAPAPQAKSPKSEEQPKVQSQMDAPQPEMENMELVQTKRRGRKNTILTSVTGVSEPVSLGRKTLLG